MRALRPHLHTLARASVRAHTPRATAGAITTTYGTTSAAAPTHGNHQPPVTDAAGATQTTSHRARRTTRAANGTGHTAAANRRIRHPV